MSDSTKSLGPLLAVISLPKQLIVAGLINCTGDILKAFGADGMGSYLSLSMA